MAFVIDTYDRYWKWDQEHSKYVFDVNGQEFAVKEVELEWGQPLIPLRIDKDASRDTYCIYDTYEDAMKFVRLIRHINY